MDRLDGLLPIPSSDLPMPKVRHSSFDLDELARSSNEVLSELASEVLASVTGMRTTLKVMADEIEASPEQTLQSWRDCDLLNEILADVNTLPDAAGSGYFKLKGLVPSRLDDAAARRYAGLILLFSARALFLAERRGIESILASTDQAGPRYAARLPDEGACLISGFAPLYSVAFSPELQADVHRFITRIARRFPAQTSYAALCVTYGILVSCGRGGRMSAVEVQGK